MRGISLGPAPSAGGGEREEGPDRGAGEGLRARGGAAAWVWAASRPGERARTERRAATWVASAPSPSSPLRPLPLRDFRRGEGERVPEDELAEEAAEDEEER